MPSVPTPKMLEEIRRRRKNILAQNARKNRTPKQIERDRTREQMRYAMKKGKEVQCAPLPPAPSAENKKLETTRIKVNPSKTTIRKFQDADEALVAYSICNAMPPDVSGV